MQDPTALGRWPMLRQPLLLMANRLLWLADSRLPQLVATRLQWIAGYRYWWLAGLWGETSAAKQQQKDILALVEEVKVLRIQNTEKDRRVAELENRVVELEQYSRINNVIVTGLRIKHRSYAQAVTQKCTAETRKETERSERFHQRAFHKTKL